MTTTRAKVPAPLGDAAVDAPAGSARPAAREPATARGLSFAETMAGPFAMGLSDPERAADVGRRTGWRCTLSATVTVPDLDAFADDPSHSGVLRGELALPGVRSRIPFSDGLFQLFSPSPNAGERFMKYEAGFTHGGQRYYFAGRKEVRSDLFGLDIWPDTTTLYSRLHRGVSAQGPVIGAGVLRLGVSELLKLLISSRALHAASPADVVASYLRFGRVFASGLVDTYVLHPCGVST